MQVQKVRQALATFEEWQENGKPHNLTIDDVITILRKWIRHNILSTSQALIDMWR